jgi:HEAT repeat protein
MPVRKAAALLACAVLSACGSPSDTEGWAKRAASRSRLDEKLDALAKVKTASGDKKAAVPHLAEVLKQAPRARAEAAARLGEIADPAAVQPLLAAIFDPAKERDEHDSNRRVAEALGALRAKEAVPALVKLARSPDGFVQVAAVDALGQVGDPGGVDALVALATGESVEPFTAKKALLALGRIGDPRAAPAVLRMLFEERPGVSFFREASFAASQIGTPMERPLLAVLEGKDAALAGWAREKGVEPGALYAKSAQLLGDVGGPEAVPALVAKLGYADPDPELTLFVRVFAAESLGRMRAPGAVKPLCDLLARERNPEARARIGEALARIGDPSALPALRAASSSGDLSAREGPLQALSRLGGKADRPTIEGARARDCASDACEPSVKAAYAAMLSRLDAAEACADGLPCWTGKLADASAAVRDRAALEVGRRGGAGEAPALADAAARAVNDEPDAGARYHAVLGLGWLAARAPLGAAAADVAGKLEAAIAADRGRTLTAGVNEEAARVAARLRRAAH